eukprot:maker-scaffold_35-snap-gene-2.87-mRNA-1 protein AED:0.00 eAED:0.00 QI:81/1/1/1/1/1/3/106/257
MSYWLHNVLKTNIEKGNGTTQVRKQYTTETSRRLAQLKKNTWSTLGANQLHLVVQTPPGEHKLEWISMHLTDFYNEIGMFVEMTAEHDDADKYNSPGKGFPPGLVYRWKNEETGEPMTVSCFDYMDYCLAFIEQQLEELGDPESKIAEGDFTHEDYMKAVTQVFTKMFRCYAILYGTFTTTLKKMDLAQHLNTSFKHYVYFAASQDLLPSDKEITPLKTKVGQHLDRYHQNMVDKPPKEHLAKLYSKKTSVMAEQIV